MDMTTNISVDIYKLLEGNVRKYDGRGSVKALGRYGVDQIMGFLSVASV
jgi:hypothetical protein